jgi:hypothetical protein
MLDLDYIGSESLSAANSFIMPTSVVGSYRAVYIIPKVS